MLKPIFYVNDDGQGNYIGLVSLSQKEYDNTLLGMQKRRENSQNFESRVFWLWTNPNPPREVEPDGGN